MEYLQYFKKNKSTKFRVFRFKPCYKWNTFNTKKIFDDMPPDTRGFKPCYKWNTFNTKAWKARQHHDGTVLNLVINGIPSILWYVE